MQCNQAFCGNPFANGPFCSSYNTPLQPNQSIYPEIVGEGQVTSITLPDGSVQFFFMPTLKWMSANAAQCHPFAATPNAMFANNNYSIPPQCNNNGGSWFIRSILPFPQNVCIPPNPRNEFPRLGCNADFRHNLNSLDFGYQVKFHNDAWSSTTDLVYFYPSLRQRDFVYTLPCKDKTVQIDTGPAANNTVCHYELVCSKPCHCSVRAPAAPMSLECLVDPKSTPKNNNMSTADDGCCSKHSNKRGKEKKKNIMWACDSKPNIASVDKSITTYADEVCDCTPAGGRETQTTPMNKALLKPKWIAKSYSGDSTSECSCDDIAKEPKRSQDNAEANLRKKTLLKTRWPAKSYSGDSMSVECICDDVSKKSNNRSEDKPMNKAPLKSKRTTKSFSGDSMSVECSCDDLSKKANNRSEYNTEAKPMQKALLMPKWTAKSKSGQSTSTECSRDDISKKPNNRSEDNSDTKPMHKALMMPKWTAKSFSGDSMTEECSCDDAIMKPNRRVNDKKNKRFKPKKSDYGCESASSFSNKDGRETPFASTSSTCSINCCTPVLKSKYSPKNLARKASSVKSDNLCPDCELKYEEMKELSTNPSSEKTLERKSSDHLLDGSLDCDTVASICDGVMGK